MVHFRRLIRRFPGSIVLDLGFMKVILGRHKTAPSTPLDSQTASEGLYTQYAMAIGAFANFEKAVDVSLGMILGCTPIEAVCVLSQMPSMRSKFLAISSLLESRSATKDQLRTLAKFQNKIDPLVKRRNRLVHDPHVVRHEKLYALEDNIKCDDGLDDREITEEELSDFAVDMINRREEYRSLIREISLSLGLMTWPDIPALPPLVNGLATLHRCRRVGHFNQAPPRRFLMVLSFVT